MLKNFDLKNTLIIGLLIVCGIGFTRFMGERSEYKKKNKELQEKFDKIQTQRDSIQTLIKGIDEKIKQDSIKLEGLKSQNLKLGQKLAQKEKELQDANNKLSDLQSDLQHTKDEIKKLKENPTNRTGQSLLNSLKEKTTKKP